MSKKRIPDSFDAEATERLADLMRQTTDWKGHNIGLEWQFKMKLQDARNILKGIEAALSDGADPNPIDGASLISVLCAYPFEKSATLLRTIRTAVALGADTERPLVEEVHEGHLYATVHSPISPLFHQFDFLSKEEIGNRIDAILSNMGAAAPRKLERIFCPQLPGERDGAYVIEPLLCSITDPEIFNMLLDLVETIDSDTVRRDIVNKDICFYDESGDEPMNMRDAHAWLIRHGIRGWIEYCNIGDTPMHRCIENVRSRSGKYPGIVDTLRRLVGNGAVPHVENIHELTPYGMACMRGLPVTATPEVFGLGAKDFPYRLSDEFDNGNIIARVLDRVRHAELSDTWDDQQVKSIKYTLGVYNTCCNTFDRNFRKEVDRILDDALSHAVVAYGKSYGKYQTMAEIVPVLLAAGADPCYEAPGKPPVWLISVREYGDCPMTQALLSALPASYYDMQRGLLNKYGVEERMLDEPSTEHSTER